MTAANPTAYGLRAATVADLPAITRIYADAVLHGSSSFELVPPDAAEMERRLRTVQAEGLPWIVAEARSGGAIAGYAYAGLYRPRPAYRHTVEDSIYIEAGHRGRGVGRLLLDRLIAEATAGGRRQMIAVIGDAGNTGSIELHRRAGFRHLGTLESVGFKFGRWLDVVLMQRALGAGADRPPDPV
ncbi:GNAT family N-acetyltransferase [Oceanibacterium hippocampi]|uniref:N-acyltransferase YncA n=1 Tax=Oceanibacterium hippocampi TaxID=745714 RepID=A0A1Y5S9P9_9PROT|nr:GNAT family N-acetyltransferase [Oceanibacterium hippocampi]SLN35004.1 N-acyltransferase YncA [Oceanibacterium hippocampi]